MKKSVTAVRKVAVQTRSLILGVCLFTQVPRVFGAMLLG